MKILTSFLKTKKGVIALCILILAAFNSGLFLYDVEKEVFIYIDVLSLCIIIPYFILSFIKFLRHTKRVMSLKDLESDIDIRGGDIIEDEYLKIIEDLKEMIRTSNAKEVDKYRDIIDYYTIWAHQIKTPIAAMRLLLEDKDEPALMMELLKIEGYVEMVLSYLKVIENDHDYHFTQVDLDKVITEEIRYYRTFFIQKKIKLVYGKVEHMVLSDEKWLAFIIGQILGNALKYTKSSGTITITFKDDTLYIEDTGIGIAKEDLPLIFDKGYSGKVGHKYKRASGIGLYLTKKYCDILDIDISVTSIVNEGTKVALYFKPNKLTLDHLT